MVGDPGKLVPNSILQASIGWSFSMVKKNAKKEAPAAAIASDIEKRDTVPLIVSSPYLDDMAKNPVVINHYNSAEVKHALDDSLRRILVEDYKFKEDHTHTDRKLIMGYTACLFAAGSTLYSHLVPYPDCRLVLIVSVAAYFILNGLMLGYAVKVEKEVIFVGYQKEKNMKIVVSSVNKRFTPDYSLTLKLTGMDGTAKTSLPRRNRKVGSLTMAKNVGSWFDVDGELAADVFHFDVSTLLASDAVSVSLPTWDSNIKYEEGDKAVHAALKSGYPRFVYHPAVKKLCELCEKKFARSSPDRERCLLFPSRRTARECQDFIKTYSSRTGHNRAATPTHSPPFVRTVELLMSPQHQTSSPEAITPVADKPSVLHIIIFPESLSAVAKLFWQHTGEGISSRFAYYCLNLWESNERSNDFSTSTAGGNPHYLQPEFRPIEQKSRQDDAHNRWMSGEVENFVEERYGRNMNYERVTLARNLLKLRISGIIGDGDVLQHTNTSKPVNNVVDDSVPNSPKFRGIEEIQERFGSGCYFLGNGTEEELNNFESEVLRSKRDQISSLFCEFPSNPLLKSVDLRRIRKLADEYDFLVVIDETIGNFVNVAVLEWADIVVSSLTKIFSGDCNVMGGSMVVNPGSPHFKAITQGLANLYEDTVWWEDILFLERNSRTFVQRIQTINANALMLANLLSSHKNGGYGGLLSVIFQTESDAADFYDKLHVAKGPSLGTNFTLASPYTILAHYGELEWASTYGVERRLIRISVGLEPETELKRLITDALSQIGDKA
ncbi:hypothetical protein HK101_011234 [Irineochytrium annulatum]|nr:hypothetical protein HK101_011234 [Irineochytrium annulatum]